MMFRFGFSFHSVKGVDAPLQLMKCHLPQTMRLRKFLHLKHIHPSLGIHSIFVPQKCMQSRSFSNSPLTINSLQGGFTLSWSHQLHHITIQHSPSLKPASRLQQVIRNFSTESSQRAQKDGKDPIPFWKRAVFVAVIGTLVFYCFQSVNKEKGISTEKVRYEELRKAQLGGDWVLTDQTGKKRSSTEFRGQWVLMYFGFTHCPDICPEELEKLIRIVRHFDAEPKMPSMLPIFISLDPERDTPSVIKDYLTDLKYPKMLGFTGTLEEITKVAKQYRAFFQKGPPDEDNDYIVDHTIVIYLINPNGEFVNFYDRSRTAERVINSVTEHVNKYYELEKLEKS